jgi:hypothetical protein
MFGMRKIALLTTSLVVASTLIPSPSPVSAAFAGVSVSKVGTTVTVTLDCSLPYHPLMENYRIDLNPGDTVVLTSLNPIGGAGGCDSLYVSTPPVKFSSHPSNGVSSLVGDVTFVSKGDASLGYQNDDGLFVSYFNGSLDTGQHFDFYFVEPEVSSFSVTVQSGGNGSASAADTTVDSGGSTTLTAVADDGYSFDYWSCTGGGTLDSMAANPATLSNISADASCTANFASEQSRPELDYFPRFLIPNELPSTS